MMNNFSNPAGMINSSVIPSLSSPSPSLQAHLKTEPCSLPPPSRSEDMLGLDMKCIPLGKWKDDIENNGMNSPDWHGSNGGFLGPNHPHHLGSSNSIPLPTSSSSPISHQHLPPALSCNNNSAMSASSSLTPLCAGCRLRILDKFYLCAVDEKWHTACLKCAECGVELEDQKSCFERDGQIYCKDDYVR